MKVHSACLSFVCYSGWSNWKSRSTFWATCTSAACSDKDIGGGWRGNGETVSYMTYIDYIICLPQLRLITSCIFDVRIVYRIVFFCLKMSGRYVTQGLKTRRLSLPRYWARGQNRREGFSSLQFFNSTGVRKFAISCKVVAQL